MEDKTYKVWHTVGINGFNKGHHISDLQYDNGIPFIVFEWLDTREGEVPVIRVEIDPRKE